MNPATKYIDTITNLDALTQEEQQMVLEYFGDATEYDNLWDYLVFEHITMDKLSRGVQSLYPFSKALDLCNQLERDNVHLHSKNPCTAYDFFFIGNKPNSKCEMFLTRFDDPLRDQLREAMGDHWILEQENVSDLDLFQAFCNAGYSMGQFQEICIDAWETNYEC